MRNAAGHLPECAQPLLLHHGLLGLSQILIGLLKGAVELRLMGGERDMLAELPQELAFAAAEALLFPARRDKDAEHPALDLERSQHHRSKPAPGEPGRERKGRWRGVRLVDGL